MFAWFRNFSPLVNEMRANRHKFFLLVLSKRHNQAIESGSTPYLHPTRKPNLFEKTKSMQYSCGKASHSKHLAMKKKKCMKSMK